MNGLAYSKKYSEYIDYEVETLGLEGQYIYRFPNGLGASVIPEKYGVGVEIAVILLDGNNFMIIGNSRITNDVIRHETNLDYRLQQIKELEG